MEANNAGWSLAMYDRQRGQQYTPRLHDFLFPPLFCSCHPPPLHPLSPFVFLSSSDLHLFFLFHEFSDLLMIL